MMSSSERSASRGRATALIPSLAVALILAGIYLFAHAQSVTIGRFDLNAFYCAARTLSAGADPYRYQPLHDCELQNVHLASPNAVVPVPLPPYAIAAFIPLSRLSLPQANVTWLLLLVIGAGVVTWVVVALTGLPVWLVGACAISALLVEPLTNGAMAPVPIALLCGAALAMARTRWNLAAVLLGFACIQPHVALPPMLAAFVLVPFMRLRIVIVTVAIVVLSLLAGGLALNVEYLSAVLPAHAASELGTSAQYSLSAVLHLIGLSDRLAVTLGSVQYAVFVVLGVWLASMLKRDLPGSVVLAPLACAVTGGTFIHQPEIAGALPFAFLVTSNLRSTLSWLGVLLLTIPWEYVLDSGLVFLAGLAFFAILAYRRNVGPITAALAGVTLSAVLLYAHIKIPLHLTLGSIPPIPAGALAEVGWKPLQDGFPPNAFWWPGHILAYLGLAVVYWCALAVIRKRSGVQALAVG